jgi:hypothetical protein
MALSSGRIGSESTQVPSPIDVRPLSALVVHLKLREPLAPVGIKCRQFQLLDSLLIHFNASPKVSGIQIIPFCSFKAKTETGEIVVGLAD